MSLNDEQKAKVSQWIADGAKLSEIQSRLDKEFGVRMTYMEVRFLIDDLKLTLKDTEPPKPPPTLSAAAAPEKAGAAPIAPPTASSPAPPPPAPAANDPQAAAGAVSVSVDKVTRPGALVSGKVTFSDGQSADWYLDQMGRLGVVPKQQGYKPAQQDVQEFQYALQDELAKMGF